LTCCSDKQKLHIFRLKEPGAKSYFRAFSSVVSIAGDEWSFAHYVLNDGKAIAFVGLNSLHVLSRKGNYHKVDLSDKGGELVSD
jgi:hypothetical protein